MLTAVSTSSALSRTTGNSSSDRDIKYSISNIIFGFIFLFKKMYAISVYRMFKKQNGNKVLPGA